MSTWFFVLLEVSVIACAIVGGVFLTFSDFVMKSLDGADAAAGIDVMQRINRDVFSSVFMALLLGMAALAPIIVGYAYLHLSGPACTLIITGGLVYLVGVFAVTAIMNVPMNNALEAMEYSSIEAIAYWKSTYVIDWTNWNWMRAVASAASAACYLLACIRLV
jgi:uncharacterized membrane protein